MLEHAPKNDLPVKNASNRSFGFVFAGFFLIIAVLPLVNGRSVRVWSIALSAVFLVLALFAPRTLAPANRLWMRIGALLHKIVSPVVLGILFFLVVTPTALIMRLIGRDLLSLRIDRNQESYWVVRTPPGPDPDSLKNQF